MLGAAGHGRKTRVRTQVPHDRRAAHAHGVGGNGGVLARHRAGVGLAEHAGSQRHGGKAGRRVGTVIKGLGVDTLYARSTVGGAFRQHGVDVAAAQGRFGGNAGGAYPGSDTHAVHPVDGRGDRGVNFESIVLGGGRRAGGGNSRGPHHFQRGPGKDGADTDVTGG